MYDCRRVRYQRVSNSPMKCVADAHIMCQRRSSRHPSIRCGRRYFRSLPTSPHIREDYARPDRIYSSRLLGRIQAILASVKPAHKPARHIYPWLFKEVTIGGRGYESSTPSGKSPHPSFIFFCKNFKFLFLLFAIPLVVHFHFIFSLCHLQISSDGSFKYENATQ